MRKIVVHDDEEAAMCVTRGRLSDSMVVQANVVPLSEIMMGDDDGGAAFGHAGRMGAPDVKMTGVAILVCEVELNEPILLNRAHTISKEGN
jgi:hypothetical protein